MKAQIIIEYEGIFQLQDLKDEVRNIEEDILNCLEATYDNEPKFDNFKVSYKVLK